MKLDKIDYKILYALHDDARLPLSKLAKKVRISKQSMNYRINKLVRDDVISEFISVINIHNLGYLTYRVYLRFQNVNENKEQEIVNHLKNHDHVLWLVSISGPWDLEVVFTAKNFIHFSNMLKDIKQDIGKCFSKVDVSMSIVNYHLKRDYLLDLERNSFTPKYYGFEPQKRKMDKLDVQILTNLSTNCRQSNNELGKKLGVSYHTIKQRIARLEKDKIIQGYKIRLNLAKLNKKHYKAALILNNPSKEEEERLYTFCSTFNFVTYLVEVLGKWQLDVEVEVEDQEQLTILIRNIRNKFPGMILDYDVFQVTKEHKLNYMPMGKKFSVNS